MRRRRTVLALLLLSALCARAAPSGAAPRSAPAIPAGRYEVVKEGSRVSAFVRSTLHDFETLAKKFKGEIAVPPGGGLAGIRIRLEFTAEGLTTGNFLRDAVLHGPTLQVEDHPKAVFEARGAEFIGRDEKGAAFRLAGTFSLHGVVRPLAVTVMVKQEGGVLTAESAFTLRLSDYKISPPTLPFISVEDVVEVKTRFVLRPAR